MGNMEIYIALVCVTAILWVIWRKKHLSVFKNCGIPGPEPSLLFGNIIELYSKGPIECHEKWTKKYGRVLGYFYGMKPVLLVSDPQLLKNVFIKDFPKFINREAFNPIFNYDPHIEYGQSVINLPGKKWKSVRSILTPSFTAAKMKQMSGSMNSSIDTMMSIMKEKAERGKVFDIFDVYQRVTMDVITRTAFGIRTDIQTNLKSKVLRATALLFSTAYRDPVIFVGLCLPYLQWFCRKFQSLILGILNMGVKPELMLRKGLIQVLQHRRSNPQGNKVDFLQLMIDTKVPTDDSEVDLKQLEAGNAESEAKCSKVEESNKVFKPMADNVIISSSLTVLLAGYETTSTALAFTTYLLGKYPEVQEQLYEEIQELVKNGKNLEYSTVNKLQLLDMILNESMRMYPPVYLFTNRYALEDVQYGDLKIPKDMIIQAPVYLLHRDPEFWSDPEKFDPERFINKPNSDGITFMPFGVGPRNCLGMRFAQLEAKLVLANVFYHFKVSVTDSQKDHLDTILRIRTIAPKNGIQVKLQQRNLYVN